MDSEVLAAKAGPSMAFFLVLAGFGGFLSSSGANVMAWSEFKRRSGKEWTRCQSMGFVFACFILNITGIGMFLASTALGGAVATVMPIQTGANLLGNMLWQTLLGMKYYTKSMRVGTIVLICAVMELSEIGPQEPSEWAPEEIQELMTKPVAIAWNCVMVLCTLISLYGVYRTLHLPMESSLKLFLFVSLVTFSTVIGASIGKLLGLVKGTVFALVAFLYFLDGVICLGGTVLANGHCDVSLFIPAQLSSQLVVNMITGYLVWGDAKYVAYPTSYLLVYALCIMGVYLNSPAMDVLGGLTRWYSIKHSRLSKGESCSNFGENVLRLLELWRRGGAAPEAYRDQLGAVLNRGLETGAIKQLDLVNLVLLQLRDRQYSPDPVLVHWLEDLKLFQLYCQHDPHFKDSFRQTLTSEDYQKLINLKEVLHLHQTLPAAAGAFFPLGGGTAPCRVAAHWRCPGVHPGSVGLRLHHRRGARTGRLWDFPRRGPHGWPHDQAAGLRERQGRRFGEPRRASCEGEVLVTFPCFGIQQFLSFRI